MKKKLVLALVASLTLALFNPTFVSAQEIPVVTQVDLNQTISPKAN